MLPPFLANHKDSMKNMAYSLKNMERNNKAMAYEIAVILRNLEEPVNGFDKKEDRNDKYPL